VTALLAGVSLFEGRFEEAEQQATDAFALGQEAGEADAFAWYSGTLTGLRLEQGRLDELIDVIGAFVATTPQLPVWAAAYAFVLCELERYDEAAVAFARLAAGSFAGIPDDQLRLGALCFAAEACRHVGDRVAARHLYEHLRPFESLSASVTVFSIGSVARSLGVLALQLDELDAADRHLRRAVERNARDRSPTWTATAQVDLALAHLQRDRRLALGLIDEAERRIDGLGAARVERRIERARAQCAQTR
jgi:tetratricopeptide (TPR) repeat protein